MTTPPVPRGNLAVESDIRENDVGRRVALVTVMSTPFGRALRNGRADASDATASGVQTVSAADVSVGACAGATPRSVRLCAGRLAALARR